MKFVISIFILFSVSKAWPQTKFDFPISFKYSRDLRNFNGAFYWPLKKLWEYTGCPIHVTSTLRSKAYNKRVGGSPHSKHLTGEAVDITFGPGCLYLDMENLLIWFDESRLFDRVIIEHDHLHLEVHND